MPERNLDAITLNLEHITKTLARIVGVFGDDWHAVEDFDDEISVRTSDSTDGIYTEVFRTSQLMNEDGRSPVADFLLSCPVVVPKLIAEVERLWTERDKNEDRVHRAFADSDIEGTDLNAMTVAELTAFVVTALNGGAS